MTQHDPDDEVVAADSLSEACEDYYMDGPYLVFTAAFHRKRGFCCNSGCRHCPYGEQEQQEPSESY